MEHLKREVSASLHPPEGHCPLLGSDSGYGEKQRWKEAVGNQVTSSRHRASSCWLSFTNSSSGYFSRGNGAMGQSKEGMSILWIAFECVVAKHPEPSKTEEQMVGLGSSIVSLKRTRWALQPHACITLGRVCVCLLYDLSQVKPSCCRGEMAVQHPCCH